MRVPSIAPPPLPPGLTHPASLAARYPAPPLGLSGRAAEVLRDLRAADAPVTPRPLPTRNLIQRLAAVSTAMHADYARHLDTLAVLDDISAAIADGADLHALRMALAPVEALLKGSVAL